MQKEDCKSLAIGVIAGVLRRHESCDVSAHRFAATAQLAEGSALRDGRLANRSTANSPFRVYGDANGNGSVDAFNLWAFCSSTGAASSICDLDSSGHIDSPDLS
jgi:hypothetical protein